MSLLHRGLLAQIMAAIDPVIETALTVYNPAAGAGSRVLLTELESMEAPAPVVTAHDAPVSVAGTTINSPLPVPVAADAHPQGRLSDAPWTAPAPLELEPHVLTAKDVVAALMQTLQGLESRL